MSMPKGPAGFSLAFSGLELSTSCLLVRIPGSLEAGSKGSLKTSQVIGSPQRLIVQVGALIFIPWGGAFLSL